MYNNFNKFDSETAPTFERLFEPTFNTYIYMQIYATIVHANAARNAMT